MQVILIRDKDQIFICLNLNLKETSLQRHPASAEGTLMYVLKTIKKSPKKITDR